MRLPSAGRLLAALACTAPALFAAEESQSQSAPRLLTSGVAVEYEQRTSEGWRWFVLDTNDVNAVSLSFVIMRGSNDQFPRTGLVMVASRTAVPPGAISGADIDPTAYDFGYPVGPHLRVGDAARRGRAAHHCR